MVDLSFCEVIAAAYRICGLYALTAWLTVRGVGRGGHVPGLSPHAASSGPQAGPQVPRVGGSRQSVAPPPGATRAGYKPVVERVTSGIYVRHFSRYYALLRATTRWHVMTQRPR